MFPWTQLFIDLAILIAVFTAFVLSTLFRSLMAVDVGGRRGQGVMPQ